MGESFRPDHLAGLSAPDEEPYAGKLHVRTLRGGG
jgi:hypothetical protein